MTTTTQITFSLADLLASPAPLFEQHAGQYQPQPAFVELDEDGQVTAGTDANTGGGQPASVWHGVTLRVPVPGNVDGRELHDYLTTAGRAALEKIHAGHTVEWDGSNYRGTLDDAAQEELLQLENALADLPTLTVAESAREYLVEFDVSLREAWPLGQTVDAAAENLMHCAGQIDNLVVQFDADDMRAELVERMAEHLRGVVLDEDDDGRFDAGHITACADQLGFDDVGALRAMVAAR